MGWFDEQARGRSPEEVSREHGRYLRAARLDRALDALAGPFGCRRFLVRFAQRGAQVRVERIETVPAGLGRRPAPADPGGRQAEALERALTSLWRNMSTGPRWDRGAVAYLRDAQGRTEIIPAFDDDADVVNFDDLPMVGPPGHPLEGPAYRELLAWNEAAIAALHQRSRAVPDDWDWFEVQDDRLLILHDEAEPARSRRLRCTTLATFSPRHGRFTWRTEGALFPEPPFAPGSFAATIDAAIELGLLTAARMGARWLFRAAVDEADTQLLVAVHEG